MSRLADRAGAGVVAGGLLEAGVGVADTGGRDTARLGDGTATRGRAAGAGNPACFDPGLFTGGAAGRGGRGYGDTTGTPMSARSGAPSLAFPDPLALTGVMTATICIPNTTWLSIPFREDL